MSSDNEVEFNEYRMDNDTDIERLHNRLNPPGVMAQALAATGGHNTGYYALEEHLGRYSSEELVDPKVIAQILSTDTESALSALRLLDSTEDFEGHPQELDLLDVCISQEDAMQKTLATLGNIARWTKRAAKTIFDDMSSYELVARYLKFHAENLKVTANARKGSFNGSKLEITTRVVNLTVRYAPVTNVAALANSLRLLNSVTRSYFNYNGETLSKVADRIPSLLNNPEQLATELNRVSPQKLIQDSLFRESSVSPGTYVSPHILGSHRLSVKQTNDKYAVRLIPSDITPRAVPSSISFTRFPINTQRQILNAISELADYLMSVNTVSIRQRRSARAERLATVVSRLTREIETQGYDRQTHDEVIRLINQYNDWVAKPYRELYGLVCRDLRAVLNVCEINSM